MYVLPALPAPASQPPPAACMSACQPVSMSVPQLILKDVATGAISPFPFPIPIHDASIGGGLRRTRVLGACMIAAPVAATTTTTDAPIPVRASPTRASDQPCDLPPHMLP